MIILLWILGILIYSCLGLTFIAFMAYAERKNLGFSLPLENAPEWVSLTLVIWPMFLTMVVFYYLGIFILKVIKY